ncbi:MAG: DUF2203 domain-containing protein [Actinobacteria bacterium]|nr:DUF2203 domain-containing protein [Actinomycetota bacterium]
MAPRHFTREEANELLAQVRPLTEQLVEHRAALVAAQSERTQLALQIAGNGGGVDVTGAAALDEQIAREHAGVARSANAIHELGGVVKDAGTGLVDFPAQVDGVEAFLCWRLGEDEIAYWHGLDDGFPGRKPLDP